MLKQGLTVRMNPIERDEKEVKRGRRMKAASKLETYVERPHRA
jgi:hypothetical protein